MTDVADNDVLRKAESGCQARRSVAVVIPCFNAGILLNEALASVQAQRGLFAVTEIIVVDDHSTDPFTIGLLQELAEAGDVTILSNTGRRGPAGTRNTGAFASKADWLAFLDADDVWLEESLAARFAALDHYPDAGFISGDFQIWYPERGILEENFFASRPRPAAYYGLAYAKSGPLLLPRPARETLETALCHSCSVVVRRDLFFAVGGFEESLMYKEDHHLWFKLSRQADLVLVPRSVFLYRQHETNMTRNPCAPFEYEKAMLDFVRTEGLSGLDEYLRTRYVLGLTENARWFRSRGEFSLALDACLDGFRWNPLAVRLWTQLVAAVMRVR